MRDTHPEALRILGVDILDVSLPEAVARLLSLIENPEQHAHSVFFVNAHTLNVASTDPRYRATLNTADYVFGDGTGVRWAARLVHRNRLKDNVNGTDLVPSLFAAGAKRGHRYYLLGATEAAIERAAKRSRELFPGWELAGYHHGYLDREAEARIVQDINDLDCQMLLVGMGNPLQEDFIARNQTALRVPLCLGVGGLFSYWAGDIERAPVWMRRLGYEWLHLLISQPHKFKRYVFGNPAFLLRIARHGRNGA
jgi:N-acetylglucosaminyldiphosphoundecaprenol N-acetyl-beta-D-mannosaminyltransferase